MTSLYNEATQCITPDPTYNGWNGVDGQLQVPTTLASLGDHYFDHTLGLMMLSFGSNKLWLQQGWYTGIISDIYDPFNCTYPDCTWRANTYGYFVEDTAPGGYRVQDFGYAALGSSQTGDEIYNPSTGCFEAYLV